MERLHVGQTSNPSCSMEKMDVFKINDDYDDDDNKLLIYMVGLSQNFLDFPSQRALTSMENFDSESTVIL